MKELAVSTTLKVLIKKEHQESITYIKEQVVSSEEATSAASDYLGCIQGIISPIIIENLKYRLHCFLHSSRFNISYNDPALMISIEYCS